MAKEVLEKVRQVRLLIGWLLRLTAKNRRKILVAQSLLDIGGIVLQGAVIGLLMAYANSLGGEELPYIQSYVSDFSERQLLFGFLVAFMLLMLASGIMAYWAERLLIRVAVEVQKEIALDVLSGNGGSVQKRSDFASNMSPRSKVRRLAQGRARGTGRMVLVLVSSVQEALKAAVFWAIMISIAPLVGIVISALAGLALGWQYLVSRQIHHNQLRGELVGPQAAKQIGEWTVKTECCPLPVDTIKELLKEQYEGSFVQHANDVYEHRLNATVRSGLTGHLLMTFAMVVGIGMIVNDYLDGATSIVEIVAFIYAARLALSSAKNLFVKMGAGSRLYLHARENLAFSSGPKRVLPNANSLFRMAPGSNACAGGRQFVLFGPVPLSRLSCGFYLEPLFGSSHDRYRSAVLTTSPSLPENVTFEKLTGHGSPAQLELFAQSSPLAETALRAWEDLCSRHGFASNDVGSLDKLVAKGVGDKELSLLGLACFAVETPTILLIEGELAETTPSVRTLLSATMPTTCIFYVYSVDALPLTSFSGDTPAIVEDFEGVQVEATLAMINATSEEIRRKIGEQLNAAKGRSCTQADLFQEEEEM